MYLRGFGPFSLFVPFVTRPEMPKEEASKKANDKLLENTEDISVSAITTVLEIKKNKITSVPALET